MNGWGQVVLWTLVSVPTAMVVGCIIALMLKVDDGTPDDPRATIKPPVRNPTGRSIHIRYADIVAESSTCKKENFSINDVDNT